MKKTWNNPAIEELNITATENDMSSGTKPDYGWFNNTTGEVEVHYYPSGVTGKTEYDIPR